MATDRSYHDMCGLAHALDLVGERWALLVVRELMLGPQRYTDLKAQLPGISTNVLSHRLAELERSGVLVRRRLPPPAASSVYELTEWGLELEPAMCLLGRWGARSPNRPTENASFSVNSMILSLRTNFSPAVAGGLEAVLVLRFESRTFRAAVGDGTLTITAGHAERPDAVLTPRDPATLAGVVYAGAELDELERAGAITVEGDRAVVEKFLGCFPLPEPAPLPVANGGDGA